MELQDHEKLLARLRVQRIGNARSQIDFNRPGALEAFELIQAKPDATPEEYEELAAKFPLVFRDVIQLTSQDVASAAAQVNKRADKGACVALVTGNDLARRATSVTTGSRTLDALIGGGFRRGTISQIKGQPSMGKTLMMLNCARNALLRQGAVLWVELEPFFPSWARACGLPLHYSSDELSDMSPEMQAAALEFNKFNPAGERFHKVVGEKGGDVLEAVTEAIRTNAYDLVVVDSLALAASFSTDRVGELRPGGEAPLVGDWVKRVTAAFNGLEAKTHRAIGESVRCKLCGAEAPTAKALGKKCPDGRKHETEKVAVFGQPPRSAVVAINQVRTQGIGGRYTWLDAGGGHALAHIKVVDLMCASAENMMVNNTKYGIRTVVKVPKSKLGFDDQEVAIEMALRTLEHNGQVWCNTGDFIPIPDLIGCSFGSGENTKNYAGPAMKAGAITQNGAFYTIGDSKEFRFQGLAALTDFLSRSENRAILEAVRVQTDAWIAKQGATE